MSLSKTLYPLLSTGSTQEDPSRYDLKNVDLDIKNPTKRIINIRSNAVTEHVRKPNKHKHLSLRISVFTHCQFDSSFNHFRKLFFTLFRDMSSHADIFLSLFTKFSFLVSCYSRKYLFVLLWTAQQNTADTLFIAARTFT